MTQTWPVTLISADPDAPAPFVAARGAIGGDVTVRLQALDGTWETCGADRARGVWPENMTGLRADTWGSKTVGFELRRDPKAIWPDISAFTPVQIDLDGVHRWTGRVAQTPVRDDLDSVISVQCEGLQAHLDDDLYERGYVWTKMGDWKDVRSALTCDLTEFIQAGQVSADRAIVLGWPKDAVVPNTKRVGVCIDLGVNATGKRIVVTWQAINVNSGQTFGVMSSNVGIGASGAEDHVLQTLSTGGTSSGTSSQTLTTAARYLWLYLYQGSGGTLTPAADVTLRITSIQMFADASYESSGASVLKADVIVKDALDRATILLNTDRSLIDAGTFNIPEFAPSEPRTPRQVWEAANAFEDRLCKIDLQGRPVFTAKSLAPEIEVGAWSAMSFEDASANDGSEVYSRVIVKGTQPDGTPLRVERTQAQQTGAAVEVIASPAADNPSFATDAASWTAVGSAITRDTGTFDTTPAAGRWDNSGIGDTLSSGATLTETFTGTFIAGTTYVLTWRMRANATIAAPYTVRFGTAIDYTYVVPGVADTLTTSWKTLSVTWTPATTTTGVTFKLTAFNILWYGFIDGLTLSTSRATIVARRGFLRSKTLDVSFTLTVAAAQQLGDLWLRAHQRTPFKGTVKLTGDGAAREILSGAPVSIGALLERTGQLIRFSDRIDQDTGAMGRDARISEVSIDPATDEATVTLDNTRAGFDALLERLGVVLGQHA